VDIRRASGYVLFHSRTRLTSPIGMKSETRRDRSATSHWRHSSNRDRQREDYARESS
jgi:hypothetical protein